MNQLLNAIEKLVDAASDEAIEQLRNKIDGDCYFTITEACRYLRVSKSKFYSKIRPLIKRHKKSGSNVAYLKSELDKYIQDNK